jgi:hypothetical protein
MFLTPSDSSTFWEAWESCNSWPCSSDVDGSVDVRNSTATFPRGHSIQIHECHCLRGIIKVDTSENHALMSQCSLRKTKLDIFAYV